MIIVLICQHSRRCRMAVPVHCITGLESVPMEAVTVGLQWDLPRAVVVRHTLDVTDGTLLRVVSDASGVLEREVVQIEHLCVSCALREDILPTLDRLAALERWDSIIAHLPVGVEASQLCRMIATDEDREESLRIAGVTFACESDGLPDLLVSDDLLVERGLHTSESDRRGVAELAARLVEYADVVAVFDPSGAHSPAGAALVRALARPGALVVDGWPGLHQRDLLAGVHHHGSSEGWVADVFTAPMGDLETEHLWRLDLLATDPIDPQRFLARLEDLGAGPHRTRGFFWLPTRPESVVSWQGAGGQVSLGATEEWAGRPRHSRIVVVGLHQCGDDRGRIRRAFLDSLVREEDRLRRGMTWRVREDGLEPWLGPICDAA
jgi:G3E family GTPase